MIKSMTGFGRGESVSEDCKVTVEIKAVNHRYCDLNMKLPRKLNYLEADIRSFLKQSIQRGKVDVFINYEDLSAKDVNVRLNEELGKEYYAALTKLGETLGISSDVTALQIGRFPDVLSLEDVAVNQESIKEQLMKALSEAAGHFSDSREKEGENLKTDILAKLEGMKENVAFIEERYPSIVSEYRKKLEDKVAELLGDTNVDENRIAAEVVIYSDKICVDEETVRLKSHIDGMRDELLKGGNVGRKLDFIAQEMNREANTILSKANDIEVSDHAIDLKTEIEGAEYRVDGERMADFINVGFGNMVNGDKIISMVSTDAAPIKRMIQNARDEGKAVDATCGRRTRAVLVMESGHLILSALTTDTLSSRCHSKRNDEDEENER